MIQHGNDQSLGPSWYANLENYLPNKDLKMWVPKEGKTPPDYQLLKIYSPKMAKTLARYKYDTGHWVAQSCESLTLYAMARYVQKALGNVYPHLPLAPEPPVSPPTGGVEPAYTVGFSPCIPMGRSPSSIQLLWII
ncbi:hypothetical protein CH63R_11015 [Colletotrichum higginsianum IMI 349063]|uniref:Uncharacterized protein n=1 Tax=Colletotrichum higginsianum (strain IMI 349063) TaxID=759273 RepID=A0A1B7Y4G8_COLHI|nr:uncharacterized protein CH63R_11015 [Colletotrichum higginsianum IMI 349063]OBR06895.1 hypothetical protein CH63R_11015 [Colletotrichum higginsianum IMI 349063]